MLTRLSLLVFAKKVTLFYSSLLLLSVVFLQGCGRSEVPTENDLILSDKVFIFSEDDRVQIANVGNNVILFQESPPFSVGDIIVNDDGQVFLRKVKDIRFSENGQYEIKTEPASLSDVFVDGRIDLTVPVDLSSSQQLSTQGSWKNGQWCSGDDTSGFKLEFCLKPEIKLHFEADFGQQFIRIAVDTGLSGSVEPKLVWKIIEVFYEEIEIALSATSVSPEINLPGGIKLGIPINIGPVFSFSLSARQTSITISEFELTLSLSKVELSLETTVGLEWSPSSGLKSIYESPNVTFKYTPPSFSFKNESNDLHPNLALGLGPKFKLEVFDQTLFDLGINFESDFDTSLVKTSGKSIFGKRFDYHLVPKVVAALENEINLLGFFKFNGEVKFFEISLAQLCGSVPSDGGVIISPKVASVNVAKPFLFSTEILGYPHSLPGDCTQGIQWSSTIGSIAPDTTDSRKATFTSSTLGSGLVMAKNKTNINLFDSSDITVIDSRENTSISGQATSLPLGSWKLTLAYTPSNSSTLTVDTPVTISSGSFTLPLASPPPSPVSLYPISSPQSGVTASPSTTNWTVPLSLKLLVFDDSNDDNSPSSGEQVAYLIDPDNTFRDGVSAQGQGYLNLLYADQTHSLIGTSSTTNGAPVDWNVNASKGWTRYIFALAEGGTRVSVSANDVLSNLNLSVGPIGIVNSVSPQGLVKFSNP
jgi:hypothetical protein